MSRGLVLALLALGACNRTEERGSGAASGGGSTVERVRQRVRELEASYGEDAYDRPEVLVLLRELESLGEDSPERLQALELRDFLRAKQRMAQGARYAPPPPRKDVPNHGPLRMQGTPPSSQSDLERVAKIKLGSTRQELLEAYGSCLVRQTWFPPRDGGPVTELFHTSPDCRDKLKPKIYRVSDTKVTAMYEGNLDTVMAPEPPKDRPAQEKEPWLQGQPLNPPGQSEP
jgi:hypothetical protein